MANNTTVSIKQCCPMLDMMHKPQNNIALIGLQLLIGVDVLPALLTIVANAIFFLTIMKTKSLHAPSNTFLAALCFNDLLIGVLSQPVFLTVIIKLQSFQSPSAILLKIMKWSSIVLNGMSLIIVLYITVDRYVAVCHPFLYQRKSTIKSYCIIVALTLVYQAVCPIVTGRWYMMIYGTINILSFAVMIFCYIKIYKVIAQKERNVLCLGTIGTEERKILRENKEERSKTFTIIILLTVFIVSYIPPFVAILLIHSTFNTANICSHPPKFAVLFMWSIFCLNLSSAVNPIVYCVYIKAIKEAAIKLLFNRGNRLYPR